MADTWKIVRKDKRGNEIATAWCGYDYEGARVVFNTALMLGAPGSSYCLMVDRGTGWIEDRTVTIGE